MPVLLGSPNWVKHAACNGCSKAQWPPVDDDEPYGDGISSDDFYGGGYAGDEPYGNGIEPEPYGLGIRG